ncbi:hypothetical protein TA05_01795 [Citrobacter rodentium]|nr:hypothetical protein TA05_01795 [Citrobacter rodentium]
MPTLTIIKHFDVIKNIASGFFLRSVDLFLYPFTLHQPQDPVNPTLMPAIFQVKMDLAIAINATGLQPELFDLSCQPEMRLLKPGVKPTRMNIQQPTEQTNRPTIGVVTDKGVLQSDSFAKYAAAFFNMSRSSVTRFSAFWSRRISA